MAETVKVARCHARAAGTGARCTLPDGHAAAHCAAGAEWPSQASEAIVELLHVQQKLRDMATALRVDADCPGAAHDPTELLRWFERDFPTLFPSPRTDLNQQARRLARVV